MNNMYYWYYLIKIKDIIIKLFKMYENHQKNLSAFKK